MMREPLVHFLLIGVLLFALHGWLKEEDTDNVDSQVINVTKPEVERLITNWKQKTGQSPSAEELKPLVDEYIRRCVYANEALKMGLDKGDPIIRRRLAQKMTFVLDDADELQDPSMDSLRSFYEQNRQQYKRPGSYFFSHIYFRNPADSQRAEKVLDQLKNKTNRFDSAGHFGDPFMLATNYKDASSSFIAREFGRNFARALPDVPVQEWQGPIRSGYGLHLVYISEKGDTEQLPFEEVRPKVKRDYRYKRMKRARAKRFQKLKKRYTIRYSDSVQQLLSAK